MTNFGINDNSFVRGKVPMTKQEIRILVLAKANVTPESIVIDVGAGTGSITIEAALAAHQGQVFAIERNIEAIELIRTNVGRFGATNVSIIHGTAPEALTGLPRADVIFVGGSGGQMQDILSASDKLLKPGGRLIITAVTVDTLFSSLSIMRQNTNYMVDAFGAQITRIRQVSTTNMFEALNPVHIIACIKGGSS